jgi:hypothetical protein
MRHSPTYCVDGREFDDFDSPETGDGQFAPFRIFVPDQQDYIPGTYETRAHAQIAADLLNAAANRAEAAFAPEVHTKRLDEARKEMVDALVEDRVGRSPHSGDLRWYVREHYSNLNDVDLQQEFNDAGLGDD